MEYEVTSHIDNITYSFLRKHGRKSKIDVNWQLVRKHFHKYGEIVTPAGTHLGQYKYFDAVTKISYKIIGNVVTISLAKAVLTNIRDKRTNYNTLVTALQYLFDNDFLLTDRFDTRKKAYDTIRSRGQVVIEHALDIKDLQTSKVAQGINSKGKRYQRKHLTRFEVVVAGIIDEYRQFLKSRKLTDDMIKVFVKKHVKNLLDKTSLALLTSLIGEKLGTNRQNNSKKIGAWVVKHLYNDLSIKIVDSFYLARLINLERQNII